MDLEVVHVSTETPVGAPPLLFVHGAWHGAWCWTNFMSYFAERGYDCWALSLRGHGASESTPMGLRGPGLATYVEDVATVARSLPAAPIVLGHSMGGGVVQRYLAGSHDAHPLAAAALLASMPPRGVTSVTLKVARTWPGLFARANATFDLGLLTSTQDLVRTLFLSADVDAGLLAEVSARVGTESYRAFVDMLATGLPRPSKARRVPMLVLGARNDWIFSPAAVASTATAYGVEPVMVDDLAHDVMLDAGWERAAAAVGDWLASLGSLPGV